MESYAASHQLSKTIDAIYECVLDPQKWPNAIESVAQVMDSSFGMLCRASPTLGTVQALHHWGMDVRRFREMANIWGDELTGRSNIAKAPLLKPFGLEFVKQATRSEEFWDQPFFTQWFRPAGFGDAASLVLYRTEHRALTFSMITRASEPMVSRENLQRMELLAPHLQRAVLLGEHIDRQNLAISRYERLLDSLSMAIVIMDSNSRVQHANVEANAVLQSGASLLLREGKVVLRGSRNDSRKLNEVIRSTSTRNSASHIECFPVFLQESAPAIAYIVPLNTGTGLRPAGEDASVALVLCQDSPSSTPTKVIASLYGLTDAESRVLEQIGSGKNRPQTAEALNIANSTVKSHLDRIFDKTGMTSQVELTRCLTRLEAPVANV